MHSSVTRQLEDRLGAVLQRLATVERRAVGGDVATTTHKLLSDFRRLADEMEHAFSALRDAGERQKALQGDVEVASRRAALLLELSPTPWLVVDRSGLILEANAAAGRALNLSQRRLAGRAFELFLDRDREAFTGILKAIREGERHRADIVLRPRERSPKPMTIVASLESDSQIMLLLDAYDLQELPDSQPGIAVPAENTVETV
jgi:PAS domain S-box-containing protein